jgi:tRNA nucleotidyltransferase (CCA-adding enzyme)
MSCSSKVILDNLESHVKSLVISLGNFADSHRLDVYIVGGIIRDALLGIKSRDIDVVVEGDAIEFAKDYLSQLPFKTRRFKENMVFKTASASIAGSLDINMDFITARREIYSSPGALPQVSPSTICDDIRRRDFTINTLALPINHKKTGNIIDMFGGCSDIKKGIVRCLHSRSFIDDPTRIIRAIRFSTRFDFEIDKSTKRYISQSISEGYLNAISRDRLSCEFIKLLRENNPCKAVREAERCGILMHIFGQTACSISTDYLNVAYDIGNIQHKLGIYDNSIDLTAVLLLLLFTALTYDEAYNSINNLSLPGKIRDIVLDTKLIYSIYNKQDVKLTSDLEIYNFFSRLDNSSIVFLSMIDEKLFNSAVIYINKLSKIKTIMNGRDIVEAGIQEGPEVGRILRLLLMARIEGKVNTLDDERILVLDEAINYMKIKRCNNGLPNKNP